MELKELLSQELRCELPGSNAQHKMAPEHRSMDKSPKNSADASVAIIILESTPKQILLIKRSEYKGHHSNQVSFPGGKKDRSDISLLHTALREAHEEVGLLLKTEHYVGKLTPLYIPVSQFMVYPHIFLVSGNYSLIANKKEVDYIIQFELERLVCCDTTNYTTLTIDGKKVKVPYYPIKNEIVWGATAMILAEFIEILRRIDLKALH